MGLGLVQGRFLTSATSIWPSGVAFYFLPIFHQSHHEFGPKCSSFRASSQRAFVLATSSRGGRQLLPIWAGRGPETAPIFDIWNSRATHTHFHAELAKFQALQRDFVQRPRTYSRTAQIFQDLLESAYFSRLTRVCDRISRFTQHAHA